MKTRTNNSYSSLEDIIKALSKHEHTRGVWVGENYSKADLIEDLKNIHLLNLVDEWHDNPNLEIPLHVHLDMTWEEYQHWMTGK
jgi:hypothetical protein